MTKEEEIKALDLAIQVCEITARGHLNTAMQLEHYRLAAWQARRAAEYFEKASILYAQRNSLQSESE